MKDRWPWRIGVVILLAAGASSTVLVHRQHAGQASDTSASPTQDALSRIIKEAEARSKTRRQRLDSLPREQRWEASNREFSAEGEIIRREMLPWTAGLPDYEKVEVFAWENSTGDALAVD